MADGEPGACALGYLLTPLRGAEQQPLRRAGLPSPAASRLHWLQELLEGFQQIDTAGSQLPHVSGIDRIDVVHTRRDRVLPA